MRFGLAVADITPMSRMPMRGYATRKDLFDRVHDPLTVTAVVLEEGDRRALIGAVDLVTLPGDGSLPGLLERLGGIVGCPPDCVMLNASHTHGGPTPSRSAWGDDDPYGDLCERYKQFVYDRIADAAARAVADLREGTLRFGEGTTDLPISRRLERDGRILHAPAPDAPTDPRTHLLALYDADGTPAALGLKVSCHAVATAWQHQITADYPGAWRDAFSAAFDGRVTPFFLQGAGADTRPRQAADGDDWRAVPHEELPDMARGLLAETLIALAGGLETVGPLVLAGAIRPVQVPCRPLYTRREQFQDLQKSRNERERRYAEKCLGLLDEGRSVPGHATVQVQTLWLTEDLALVGLDVEPLCALGFAVEEALAPARVVLLGYTNGSCCYLPTTAEIERGGYEAESYLGKTWTGPLGPGIEESIIAGLTRACR
ncbi:MAG: hypothetical protein GXY85_03715 [Candidatus Brocadiaceae bacterium]|nr:hypothetical protein [Candidatus Brocadiaceae bacterium]